MQRFSLIFLALSLVASMTHAAERPNVLLITADDLGIQLSCYGDTTINTPHIDKLAGRSVQFETAYVAQASCSPSRSTMFTGMYPHGNGQYGLTNADVGFRVHEELVDDLLPNVLKRAGYRTGIIGKLHVDPQQEFQFDVRNGKGFGNRNIRQQVQFAREFVSAESDEPWFLMFNVFDPHVAKRKLKSGKTETYLPDQVQGIPETPLTADDVSAWPWQGIDRPEQRKKIAGYYNCVQRIDVAMGLLMETLEQTGQADNVLIIFLGDHGPPFSRGKTSCYEAGLRVPFIVHWPGLSQPHVSEKLVSSSDIYPTILDAAGLETPSHVHGRSLRPVLTENSKADWRKTLVGEFHYHGASPFFPRRAITDGRYKLIHNLRAGQAQAISSVDGDKAPQYAEQLPADHPARLAMERLANPPEWELYDLASDAIEFHNRAGDPTLAETESRLKQALTTWQAETNDPFRNKQFRQQVMQKYQK
ncbi:sulfatase family protein [Rubinisphaera brasiliensis]|uniref:N-sulfoglucosamine sulfohydrolase n=1 Tax=Rubinisphaera brasiliensis (strain ATCC 49424 / DSM 5305 / JCM 21570 / IAM 15109 / NBRC 103401 / IFAM 1448) TaxID=756272 RepID=F0SNG8_RUBBR|nr:sulfatase [Rubinisphaera brasiliensis]ADY57802.1 N-sulfoglucosamine sulfohydrolase [Rubinisphaera brasiliensis DSM 5305]